MKKEEAKEKIDDIVYDMCYDREYKIIMNVVDDCIDQIDESKQHNCGTAPTPNEFKERMQSIFSIGDKEECHIVADDYLCSVLTELGYSEGVEVFENSDKWYS